MLSAVAVASFAIMEAEPRHPFTVHRPPSPVVQRQNGVTQERSTVQEALPNVSPQPVQKKQEKTLKAQSSGPVNEILNTDNSVDTTKSNIPQLDPQSLWRLQYYICTSCASMVERFKVDFTGRDGRDRFTIVMCAKCVEINKTMRKCFWSNVARERRQLYYNDDQPCTSAKLHK